MSGLSKLEKLMYSIGVVDKATGPVNKIMAKINQLSSQASGAQDQMMRGFMGAAGGGLALSRSLAPSIDHVAALGEVQSLGVMQSGLDLLTKTSFEFGAQFGGNSAEFVRSAYDIQSAINGLSDADLSSFTKASNILAKATKADASTISTYMGTMYGAFKENANKIGKANWVEQIAGQTAKAVQLYKTTGVGMNNAFSMLGGKATDKGVDSAEQMAVLGSLQLMTGSGSKATTQYAGFIDGLFKAQKALGLSFYQESGDKKGDMLPTSVIINKINELFAGAGAGQKAHDLNKAFGSKMGADFVTNMTPGLVSLTQEIEVLRNISDATDAINMAKIIASPWDRLSGTFNAAATAMGQRLLPVVEPFIEMLSTAFMGVVNLTEQFPVLSSVISVLVVGVVGVMTVLGLLNIIMGLSKFGMIGLSGVTGGLGKSFALMKSSLIFARGALLSFNILAATSGGVLGALKVLMLGATSGAWAFASSLLAIAWPIALVVAGVALVAAVIYKYWQPIKAFMSGFWDGLVQGFFPVLDVFSQLFTELGFVGDGFSWVSTAISSIVGWFSTLFTPINATSEALAGATNAGMLFGEIVGGVFNLLLTPIKGWIMLMTKGIGLLKSVAGWVSGLFGEDTDISANKRVEHAINNQAIDMANSAGKVVPFNINKMAANNAQIDQAKQNNHKLSNASVRSVEKSNFLSQFSQSTHNSNNARTDQSKRVYVDNLTIKSDDAFATSEQLMELAS